VPPLLLSLYVSLFPPRSFNNPNFRKGRERRGKENGQRAIEFFRKKRKKNDERI
jgi:hypothetical protein